MEVWRAELYHHGIKGQKWGVRRGPPYPLDEEPKRESKAFNKKGVSYGDIESGRTATKKVLTVLGSIAVASLVGYGIYKYRDKITSGKKAFEGLIQIDAKESISLESAFNGQTFSNANEFKQAVASLRDKTQKRADSMFDKQHWDSLSQEQRDDIYAYTDTAYLNINYALRYGEDTLLEKDIPAFRKSVKNISEAIAGSALDSDAVAQRIITGDGLSEMLVKCGIDAKISGEYIKVKNPEKLIGGTLTDSGFYSCSADPSRDENFSINFKGVLLTTILPKGTKAMYVAPISKSPGEAELLVQKGTTFCIKDFVTDTSTGEIIELIVEAIRQE